MIFEYSKNTIISFALALLVFVPFYFILGNTPAIWSVVLILGIPHIIFASLGYLGSNVKRNLIPFVVLAVLGVLVAFSFYRFIPVSWQFFVFLVFFVWHMLCDEQMFEATITKGFYKVWQNNWPIVISWGSAIIVLLAFAISVAIRLKTGFIGQLSILFAVMLCFFLWRLIKALGDKEALPWGYIFFFVFILVPAIFLAGRFWKGELYTPPVFLGVFHFVSWYVFYTKRLNLYPKDIDTGIVSSIFFGWRKNNFYFWRFIIFLQAIFVFLFLLYFYTPFKNPSRFLASAEFAPFWTLVHITISSLQNRTVKLPKLEFRLRLRQYFRPT